MTSDSMTVTLSYLFTCFMSLDGSYFPLCNVTYSEIYGFHEFIIVCEIPDMEVLEKAGLAIFQECLMSDFQRKSSMENYRRESALKVARRNATKTASKPLGRILTYQWGLGNRLHRSNQSREVSSTKKQLSMKKKKKRICEAERKLRECKANTNGSPADSMTLTCSTCNRQFRARIGLVSHQRTQQHTLTYSRNNDGLSH